MKRYGVNTEAIGQTDETPDSLMLQNKMKGIAESRVKPTVILNVAKQGWNSGVLVFENEGNFYMDTSEMYEIFLASKFGLISDKYMYNMRDLLEQAEQQGLEFDERGVVFHGKVIPPGSCCEIQLKYNEPDYSKKEAPAITR